MQTTEKSQPITPPQAPGEWSLSQIQQVLKRPLPNSMLKTRKQGNKEITYISWHMASSILDKYCPGWTWQITEVKATSDRLFLIGRLTIPTSNGEFFREASGTESLECSNYGDPSSNAESMAFRRAGARFGLGLYLYG